MTPRFINKNDFLNYWGKNLDELLRDDDNPSLKSDTFLARVEIRLTDWVDSHTFRTYDWFRLTPHQLEHLRYALLEQAMYMWRCGDVGMDNGYQENGSITPRAQLEEIEVCTPAINHLITGGLFSLKIQNRKRYMNGSSFGTIGAIGSLNPTNIPQPEDKYKA